MPDIDSRLREPEGEMNLAENFNRVLDMVDTAVELPTVATTDEGKVLTVDNEGKWTAANVPTELPEVTASDNGDVLSVVDGEWGKVKPSNDIFEVVYDGGNLTTDTTFAEIIAALDAGKTVVAKWTYDTDIYGLPCCTYTSNAIQFSGIAQVNTNFQLWQIKHTNADVKSHTEKVLTVT